MYRSHRCHELNKNDVGQEVELAGWVNRRRDHGKLIFIDLRDRWGQTQIVFDPATNQAAHQLAEAVRIEFVLQIKGKVRARPQAMINEKIATGEIELEATELKILSKAKTPPFEIDQDQAVNEEVRLKYRYLDLRRERMKNNLQLRHRIIKEIRDFYDQRDFLEVETPILIKGTPEGSREYIVPSRLYPGKFYVLPQSPQQLKQLLMVAGVDRYFQIARCFRDEDQRGDRQPEFTQLDVERSFITEEDILGETEELLLLVTKKFRPDKQIQAEPFPRLSYQEAMERFGSDKPDLRFGLEIVDVSDLVKTSKFKVFAQAETVRGIVAPDCAGYSRKEMDELTLGAQEQGAQGLAWIALTAAGAKGPIAKFFSPAELTALQDKLGAKTGDMLLFIADKEAIVLPALGWLRLEIGKRLGLMDYKVFAFCIINHFPLFELAKETGELSSVHHPFTSPHPEDFALLEQEPLKVRSLGYDFVLNGTEIAGGSIRIHDGKLQKKIFELLNISEVESERRFGHMLQAFDYGVPPHGGIAWGLDRLIMIFAGEANIREVMAFPKDQRAKDLMLGAPTEIAEPSLKEVHIKVQVPKDKSSKQ